MRVELPKTGLVLVDKAFALLEKALNELDTNVPRRVVKTETFTATNTDLLIRHGLGYPPKGWIVRRKDIAGDVYDGTAVLAPYTSAEWIHLKCTTLATITVEFY